MKPCPVVAHKMNGVVILALRMSITWMPSQCKDLNGLSFIRLAVKWYGLKLLKDKGLLFIHKGTFTYVSKICEECLTFLWLRWCRSAHKVDSCLGELQAPSMSFNTLICSQKRALVWAGLQITSSLFCIWAESFNKDNSTLGVVFLSALRCSDVLIQEVCCLWFVTSFLPWAECFPFSLICIFRWWLWQSCLKY